MNEFPVRSVPFEPSKPLELCIATFEFRIVWLREFIATGKNKWDSLVALLDGLFRVFRHETRNWQCDLHKK